MSCNGTAEPATWLLRCRLGAGLCGGLRQRWWRGDRRGGRESSGLHCRRDQRHHHTLEQVHRLVDTQCLCRAIDVVDDSATAGVRRHGPQPQPRIAAQDRVRVRCGTERIEPGAPTPEIGTSPGAGTTTPLEIGVVASAGSVPGTGGVVRPPGVAPVGLVIAALGSAWLAAGSGVSAGLAAGSGVSAGLASASSPSAGTAAAGSGAGWWATELSPGRRGRSRS